MTPLYRTVLFSSEYVLNATGIARMNYLHTHIDIITFHTQARYQMQLWLKGKSSSYTTASF